MDYNALVLSFFALEIGAAELFVAPIRKVVLETL